MAAAPPSSPAAALGDGRGMSAGIASAKGSAGDVAGGGAEVGAVE